MTDETKKVADDAAKKQQTSGATGVKKDAEGSAFGEAARKSKAGDGEGTAKATAENLKASTVSQSDFDALRADFDNLTKEHKTLTKDRTTIEKDRDDLIGENEKLKAQIAEMTKSPEDQPKELPDEDQAEFAAISFRVRGILMAILIKLPAVARYVSDGEQLDRMFAFVNQFETGDERLVAVELIKAIAEVDMSKIASGAYEQAVHDALKIINGEEVSMFAVHSYDDQVAAAGRLQMATAGFASTPLPEAAKVDLQETTKVRRPDLGSDGEPADSEQEKARARLYGLTGA